MLHAYSNSLINWKRDDVKGKGKGNAPKEAAHGHQRRLAICSLTWGPHPHPK